MEKQRISIYMDSDLVRRADAYQGQADCRSRNEFVSAAMENYIVGLQGHAMEDALVKRLAGAIEKAVDFEAVKISKGLFRYAMELNVLMLMMAQTLEFTPDELREFRREAVTTCGARGEKSGSMTCFVGGTRSRCE